MYVIYASYSFSLNIMNIMSQDKVRFLLQKQDLLFFWCQKKGNSVVFGGLCGYFVHACKIDRENAGLPCLCHGIVCKLTPPGSGKRYQMI